MAVTRLADVIQPTVFTQYVIQRTMELCALLSCGIISHNEAFDGLASGPNSTVNMPYFEDLTGESQNMVDDGKITPSKIGTNKDVAIKIARTNAWGSNGLAALLSGADPMGAIAELVAKWWSRDMQRILLCILNGIFASEEMKSKVYDISSLSGAAANWSGAAFVEANQVMGDAKSLITAVAMHSIVEAELKKRDLIEYKPESEGGIQVPHYMGKRVIVDDSVPYDPTTKVASAYLFGNGAIALGNGSHPNIIQTEIDRDKMESSGIDYLINRKIFILHPRGIRWTGAELDDIFPANEELSNKANWQRVYEEKAIRMVEFKFKVAK